MRELKNLGVAVEPERWWDEDQTGDILHYIGRPATLNVRLAHDKGFKVVMTDLLDQTASRSAERLFLQRNFRRLFGRALASVTSRLDWGVFRQVDAMVYAVPHEWEVAKYVFGADPGRGRVIPHGLEEEVLEELARPQEEENYLVSVATIAPRKNSVLLAEAARRAEVPVVFLGKPYSEGAPYYRRFLDLVDDRFVRYPGFVSAEEKYSYLRGARGFALLSQFESGCIAVFEAAGSGLPLFLSDLPWARKSYPSARAISFGSTMNPRAVAPLLKAFFEQSHRAPGTTFPILSWQDVARIYLALYQELLPAKAGEMRLVEG